MPPGEDKKPGKRFKQNGEEEDGIKSATNAKGANQLIAADQLAITGRMCE
jgi:hypothetical protein